MTRYIDFHTHTNYSDGVFLDPLDLTKSAALKGIDVLAITDHDNSVAYGLGRHEAQKWGITLLPGAEITTNDYHLLALNFDPDNKALQEFLAYSRELQKQTTQKRIDILRDNGMPISMEMVERVFPYSRLGKYNLFVAMTIDPDCRQIISQRFPGKNPAEVFKGYLGKKGIAAYVKHKQSVTDKDTIQIVHAAGGIVGIAHPIKDIKQLTELDTLLGLGMDFLEVQPYYRGKEAGAYTTEDIEEYARVHGIPISFGSDYHGPSFDRQILSRGENVLNPDLEDKLNQGHVKNSGLLQNVSS